MARQKRLPKPEPRPEPRALRGDDWQNLITGLGVYGVDKRLGSEFFADLVTHERAEELWRGDDIAARIVETVPSEETREGWELKLGDDGDDKDSEEAVEHACRELGVHDIIREARCHARALGGAGVFLGVDDGQALDQPLDLERVQALSHLTLFSPRELIPFAYYSDMTAPRYGEVASYRLTPLSAPPGSAALPIVVHESRIVRFSGMRTTRRVRLVNALPGWDDSIFTRILKVINDFQTGWQGAGILLRDFAPAVLKLKGLAELITSEAGPETLSARARALENARSIARVTIVDAEGEDFKRETVNVTGLAELLEKLMLRLASAANMPVSLLMGQAPAGLNATGDSDLRYWFDQVRASQKRNVEPPLRRILEVLMASKTGPTAGQVPDNWSIQFNPLWQLTDLERATQRKTVADTDVAYINAGVLPAAVVMESRFGGDTYSPETAVDVDEVNAMLDEAAQEEADIAKAEAEAAAQKGAPNGPPPPKAP